MFDVTTLVEETVAAEQPVGDEALLRVDPVDDPVAVEAGGRREDNNLEQAGSLSEELSEVGSCLFNWQSEMRNIFWENISYLPSHTPSANPRQEPSGQTEYLHREHTGGCCEPTSHPGPAPGSSLSKMSKIFISHLDIKDKTINILGGFT